MLNIFLTKMSQHPELMHTDELRAFLTEHGPMFEKSKNSYLTPSADAAGVLNQTLVLCQSYFRSVSSSPSWESKQLFLAKCTVNLKQQEGKLQELYVYVSAQLKL